MQDRDFYIVLGSARPPFAVMGGFHGIWRTYPPAHGTLRAHA